MQIKDGTGDGMDHQMINTFVSILPNPGEIAQFKDRL